MNTVLFPGSFDPFTVGHASLVARALLLFDEVIVAVGHNESKPGWLNADARVRALRALYKDCARVRVESYSGLTTDFAIAAGAKAILRGVRSLQDFEYELHMADINRQLTGIDTVCLFTEPQHAAISSSVVRELAHLGRDISPFIPAGYNIPADVAALPAHHHTPTPPSSTTTSCYTPHTTGSEA
ncbi:MAG: pantetheine-phosphate adenylyltransferase [Bacteroidaceae bacterium]|nr:pantetheine-phosphate adenylyltransferase [Bacteroidaceae bacterium]